MTDQQPPSPPPDGDLITDRLGRPWRVQSASRVFWRDPSGALWQWRNMGTYGPFSVTEEPGGP